MSRKDEIKKLIIEYQRRLQKLKEQKAKFGINTPPEILTEIEDIEKEIEQLQINLGTLNNETTDQIRETSFKPIQNTTSKHRVQIYLQGDFSSLSIERKFAAIDAFAAVIGVSPETIELYRISEGSIIFDLGIPHGAAERLHSLLQSNNAQLRLLKIEKVILEREPNKFEEWVIKDGKFEMGVSVRPVIDELPREQRENWLWKLYIAALTAFRQENWAEATKYFAQILNQNEDFVEVYQSVEIAHRQLELQRLYEEGLNSVQLEMWREAIVYFRRVMDIDFSYQNVEVLLMEADKQLYLSNLYQQGIRLVHAQEWTRAISTFQAITEIDPTYRDVLPRLEQARMQLELLILYEKGEQAFQEENWGEALDHFRQVMKIDPKFRDTMKLLREVKEKEHIEIIRLYERGRELQAEGRNEEALELFREYEERKKRFSMQDETNSIE